MSNKFLRYILVFYVYSLVAVTYNPENFLLTQQELQDDQWFVSGLHIQLCTDEEKERFSRIEQEYNAELACLGISLNQPLPENDARVAAIVQRRQEKYHWEWWSAEPIVLTKEQIHKLQSGTMIRFMRNNEGNVLYLPLTMQDINLLLRQIEHPEVVPSEQQRQLLHTINVLQVGRDVLLSCIQFFSQTTLEQLSQCIYAPWLRTSLQRMYELPWYQKVLRLKDHISHRSITFAPNGKFAVYVSGNIGIDILELDESNGRWRLMECLERFEVPISFTPNSKFLILKGCLQTSLVRILHLEEMKTGRLAYHEIKFVYQDVLYALDFSCSPDGRFLACIMIDGSIVILCFDEQTKKWYRFGEPLKSPANCIRNLVFSQDGKMLVSMDWLGDITVWKFDEASQQWNKCDDMPEIIHQESERYPYQTPPIPNYIAITADNMTIVTDCYSDTGTGTISELEFDHKEKKFKIKYLNLPRYSPDRKFVISYKLGNEGFYHIRPNRDIYNFCIEEKSSCTVC